MSPLSILAQGERLRERLLTDVATDLRTTCFQSPAEDEKEEGLSLDHLTRRARRISGRTGAG